ncbi:hypothetical protein [Chitinophaga japonensis]|uniref:Uncharacterized protein n=1 Tax=Chitinophaga japonensis TaxID=104662 RepID=A0A562T5R1_CHIJA|nr:hypothetical protein [Chitinophaga japonensis]TWI88877.1 hypothetical protein LX66_2965 [Chitinophaga japonensis]
MKQLFITFITLLLAHHCFAQHVYQIHADTVHIYNTCDTAELVLENRTKGVQGFLFNKGNGVTEFRRLELKQIGIYQLAIQGQDTISLNFPAPPNNQLKDFLVSQSTSDPTAGNFEDLYTYDIPAGKLAADGDKIRACYVGSISGTYTNINHRYIALVIGGIQSTIQLGVSNSSSNWKADVLFMRTGPATGSLVFSTNLAAYNANTKVVELTGLNFNNPVPFNFQAAGGGDAGDVTVKIGTIKYEPAAMEIGL